MIEHLRNNLLINTTGIAVHCGTLLSIRYGEWASLAVSSGNCLATSFRPVMLSPAQSLSIRMDSLWMSPCSIISITLVELLEKLNYLPVTDIVGTF